MSSGEGRIAIQTGRLGVFALVRVGWLEDPAGFGVAWSPGVREGLARAGWDDAVSLGVTAAHVHLGTPPGRLEVREVRWNFVDTVPKVLALAAALATHEAISGVRPSMDREAVLRWVEPEQSAPALPAELAGFLGPEARTRQGGP